MAMSLSRNADPVMKDYPQTSVRTVSCRNYFLSNTLQKPNISARRGEHHPPMDDRLAN